MQKTTDKIKNKVFMQDTDASAVPLILIIATILICGALFSLLFIEIAFPLLSGYIPAGDAKNMVMMLMRAIPLFLLFGGIGAAVIAGIKRQTGVV